jgi:hypothetical protein
MQQRAGLLFLSKKTGKIFLILENERWTLPTFSRKDTLLNDAQHLLDNYSQGKIVPIELYLSEDKGFEFGTYICIVDKEFVIDHSITFCWANLKLLPKQLHAGLKTTLNNQIIKTKIETILEIENGNYTESS